jgi:hypothetical protein
MDLLKLLNLYQELLLRIQEWIVLTFSINSDKNMPKVEMKECGTESMSLRETLMIFIRNLFGNQSKFVSMFFKPLLKLLVQFLESIKQSETQEVNNNKLKPLEDLMEQIHPQVWEEELVEDKFQASKQ